MKIKLKEFFLLMRTVNPPASLRINILSAIEASSPIQVFRQLRTATIMSVFLLFFSFSSYLVSVDQMNPVAILDVSPTSFAESILLELNGLTSDAALITLVQ